MGGITDMDEETKTVEETNDGVATTVEDANNIAQTDVETVASDALLAQINDLKKELDETKLERDRYKMERDEANSTIRTMTPEDPDKSEFDEIFGGMR